MERSDIRVLSRIKPTPGFRCSSTRATGGGKHLPEEVTLSRAILAAACFILGTALLIPVSLRLWTFVVARLAPPEITYLPEPLVHYVLYLNGREIGDVTVLTTAAVLGAALLLGGLRIVRWRRV